MPLRSVAKGGELVDKKNLEIPAEIRNFLDGLLTDAGMMDLDEAMHEEMIKELYERLDKFMLTTIVESLPGEKLTEFTKMAEGGKGREELEIYLKANIPEADKVFARAMLAFRDLYLGNVAVSRNAKPAVQK